MDKLQIDLDVKMLVFNTVCHLPLLSYSRYYSFSLFHIPDSVFDLVIVIFGC